MSLTEDQLTAWFEGQRRLDARRFPIGIGDDMAQVRLEVGDSVFVTTDMLLEGVHFDLASATLEQVGYKAMATCLSDCAAMATRPLAAVVSLGLPSGFTAESVKLLHAGLLQAADRYDCPLVGGDTTCWKDQTPLAVNVAMLSGLAGRKPITRAGARVGDAVCVTGSLGGSLAQASGVRAPRPRGHRHSRDGGSPRHDGPQRRPGQRPAQDLQTKRGRRYRRDGQPAPLTAGLHVGRSSAQRPL